ncbi:MAG: T9SS type A sorting domain-containing protein [Bacteroidales bacterium]|nr:T9SS type A sorting domain-containing protein [Bacteroidales bacterium]
MNKRLFIPAIAVLLFYCLPGRAQTDPGTANLMHQWTFDDGTANNAIALNPLHGTLQGGATIASKALVLSAQGQYLSFSGTALALNNYPAISQEIWYSSVAGANTGFTMLSYFGNTSGGLGYNYISASTARQDNISRIAISNGTYSNEIFADEPEYDDGLLHQMVSVINPDSVILFIDGELVSKSTNTIPLTAIGTSLAYLGKGGYTSDPTWVGSISQFSIYNKTLSPGEVKFLYQQGAEQSKMITSTVSFISFDEYYTSQKITVSAQNISDTIKITAPAGITVTPSSMLPGMSSAIITMNYDTAVGVDGNVEFSCDSAGLTIPVKSFSNACFSKLYPFADNLITNPYISSLDSFSGWGNRSINTDPDYVYCGATSGKVTGNNGGSLDVTLTGQLLTNTIYRIKARVYAIGGPFQIGVFGWNGNQADFNKSITITGSWQDVDFTFTTGETLGNAQGIFFNNYGLAGTTGYIDNWEMYAVPKVYSSSSFLDFLSPGSKKTTLRGVNLLEDIIITASDGFTVAPSTIPADVKGDTLTITYTGNKTTNGYIFFTSGNVKDSMFVKGSVEPALFTSVALIAVDEINDSATFAVTGYNLTTGVTLTAPSGITLSGYSLPSDVAGTIVKINYDGLANSSGIISLTSGTATANIDLIASRNDECFIPLFPERENLITDPTCNYFETEGWGDKGINTDPAFVYCGSRSGKVTGNGSLDRVLTGVMKPNTTYRVKAKVYKESPVNGEDMGHVTYTLNIDSASNPEAYRLITEAMDSACGYFNKYTPFIENIYVYYDAGIPTAQASYHGSIGFGPNTRYMWVGTAIHEMAHYFGSGTTTTWQSLMASGVWAGTVATALMNSINGGIINGDSQHFWPYGINQKEEITSLGSLAVQHQALSDAVRIIKAMLADDCDLPTNNPPVGIGIYGWNAISEDIYHEVTISNSWQDIDFTFTTGPQLKASQGIYFNSGTGYIDNWEMYEIPVVNIPQQTNLPVTKIYFLNGRPVTELALARESLVNIGIYDLQGRIIVSGTYRFQAGTDKKIMNVLLPEGIYIVKLESDDFTVSKKAICQH